MKFTDKQIEEMIEGIEKGTITLSKLPIDYYIAITDYLISGVLEGFGETLKTVSLLDLPLLEELLTNIYTFSAAKTFQQTKEITALLVNEDGEVRSSKEFNNLAKDLYNQWNNDWGKTEYNTAIGQADMAVKWQTIEKQKDIMPNLRYSAIGDACDICAPLDGLVAPVEDPIWDSIYPTNHFNCQCVVLQEDAEAVATENSNDIVDTVVDKMNPMFNNNVGKSGEIFPKEHPYYEVAKEYKEYAKANFDLPIPNFKEEGDSE